MAIEEISISLSLLNHDGKQNTATTRQRLTHDKRMEVICTNDNFPAPVLAFYAEFGIQTPKRDKMYTVRQVKRHTTGETGILLNEIKNPDVPVKHPVMGEVWFEPTFNVNRFATLMGQPVRQEEMEDVNA